MKRKSRYAGGLVLFLVFLWTVSVRAGSPAKPATPVLKGTAHKNEVTLTWNQVKNARGYHIYLYYSADQGFRRVLNISARAERRVTLKGSLGRVYSYKIRAYNKKANKVTYSSMSKELQIKTAPSKASLKLAEKRSVSMTQLNWNKVSSADGYQVIRSEKKEGPYRRIAVLPGKETISFQDTNTEGKKWFYRVRAYSRNPGSRVYGAYSDPARTSERPLMVIGDSRTVMLKELIGGKTTWICKISMGYKWLAETAVKEAEKALKKNSDIVIWLGVNDPYNISDYITWLNEKIPVWRSKGARIYIMAVGQVEKDPFVDNEEIREFNARMKSSVRGARYIDLYTYLEKAGYRTTDGTHYDDATSRRIYHYMKKNIR